MLLPKEIIIKEGASEKAVFVGPALWGSIYRSSSLPFCYRLIPLDYIHSLEKIKIIQDQIQVPRQKYIAPITDTFQIQINDQEYFCVQYDTAPYTSYTEIIKDSDPEKAFRYGIKIVEKLPYWWEKIGNGIIPYPSEFLFIDATPVYLKFPVMGLPPVNALFDFPERCLYLAPEIFSKTDKIINKSFGILDIYAVCSTLMQCFFSIDTNISSQEFMKNIVSGNVWSTKNLINRLPEWSSRIVKIRSLIKLLFEITSSDLSVRSKTEVINLVIDVEEVLPYFKPEKYIEELLQEKKPDVAYDFLNDIISETNNPQYILKAAQIAEEDLKLWTEAIELYEKAIQISPSEKAYLKQLLILLEKYTEYIIKEIYDREKTKKIDGIFDEIDKRIIRNFNLLSAKNKKENLNKTAKFIIQGKKYKEAAQMIHPFLFDKDKTFLWWEFDKTLLYAETLIGMKRYEEASGFLKDIQQKLIKVKNENRLSEELIQQYGRDYTKLQVDLFEKQKLSKNKN